jgi:DNA-directed RNA polymerase subunit K/omega
VSATQPGSADAKDAPDVPLANGMPLSRFHMVVVACLRAHQLHSGSRPRVDPGGHKLCRVAVMEVEGSVVSWFLP